MTAMEVSLYSWSSLSSYLFKIWARFHLFNLKLSYIVVCVLSVYGLYLKGSHCSSLLKMKTMKSEFSLLLIWF